MNLSQALLRVRDVLDDSSTLPAQQKYADAQIVRHLDEQMRTIFRAQVQANKEYHNYTLHALDSQAYSIVQNVWEYRLPSWVTHVTRVFIRTNDGSLTGSFSPYAQPQGQSSVTLNNEITKSYFGDRPRWTWEGNHTLRLWGFSTAQKLTVLCAKLPPRMFKGTIDAAHVSASKLYMPALLTLGEQDLEEGALINCDVQVISTTLPASTNFGVIKRCVYSTPLGTVSAANRTELLFDSAFTPLLPIGDAIESIIPLPDQHTRYLILKVAVACLEKKNNMPAILALADELRKEATDFTDFASTPRDRQGPYFKRSSTSQQAPLNLNRRRQWGIS